MPVSDTPWSNFTQADYTPEQWARACLIDTGQGDVDSKSRYKIPVREPDGTLNRNGIHAAAGGHGIGAVQGVAPEIVRAAARKLVAIYRQDLEQDPPPSLLSLAGMSGGRSSLLLPWEWRTHVEPLELRDSDSGKPMAVGYAFRYNRLSSDLGGFVEQVAPGSANKTIQEQDIRGLFNHNPDHLIGRKGAGTLSFQDTPEGMRYFDELPDTSLGRDLAVLLKRGDIYGSSFSFRTAGKDGADWSKTDTGYPMRTIKQMVMRDVGPVTFPAYSTSDVALRSFAELRSVPFEEVIAAVADGRLAELLQTDGSRPGQPHRIRRRY